MPTKKEMNDDVKRMFAPSGVPNLLQLVQQKMRVPTVTEEPVEDFTEEPIEAPRGRKIFRD